jgi:hypothetical protein
VSSAAEDRPRSDLELRIEQIVAERDAALDLLAEAIIELLGRRTVIELLLRTEEVARLMREELAARAASG